MEEHRPAGFRLQMLGVEILDALVELVHASEGRLLAEDSDDGSDWQCEEAEEDVDQLLFGLGEHDAVLLLVDEQLQAEGGHGMYGNRERAGDELNLNLVKKYKILPRNGII